ncbi:AAA family ATPase [Paenibacillus taichungensis]|uniref:AAA family ATPase n=1 Tax=Paenibacillus taichungensis TaxID=484184 RepID=UPI0035DDFEB1
MSINKAIIKNWRSIGDNPGVDLEFGRITVLSGTNDSGKTAILLGLYGAIRYLYTNFDDDEFLDANLHLEGSKHQKSNGDLNKKSSISVITSMSTDARNNVIDKLDRKIAPKIDDPELLGELLDVFESHAYLKYEIINHRNEYEPLAAQGNFYLDESIHDKYKVLLNKYHAEDEVGDILSLPNWLWLSPRSGGEFKFKSFFISPNRNYNPHQQTRKSLGTTYLGYNVTELVGFVQKIRTEEMMRQGLYSTLLRYVRVLFPEIVSISTNVPEGMQDHDVFIEWNINGTTKIQPLTRSGSGVVSALYLAGRLLSGMNNETIGFIDEPETGMHPKLQVRFLKLLRELSSDFDIQWIISTHSPFIMKNLKQADRLYLIQHDGSQTTARAIEPHDKSTVFQAIGAYLPDTISSSGFVFVEGTTESTLLPLLLEKCKINIEEEGLVIIPLGGDNIYSISPADLIKIHPKAMVILDSDLSKSLKSGGHLMKKKMDYQEECCKNGVEIYISTDYRTIENMYPSRCVSRVLNISETELDDNPFIDLSPLISNKISFARSIAEDMTGEEALRFPLIRAIMQWWEQDH